ncbi:hypothetical protein GOBAR_AA03949 [Gossypium barbadense]|uniref:Uncharacterized protein n=1 Tax=Gossypium barbadense TaxID=3634 RepID=A0A2P5YM08_GOSBA|nr:hypothetical protein GOBAR_AA03949 [Gossypium barbadense]
MEGRAKFRCELEVCRLDDLKEEPPRFSRQEGSDHVSNLNLFKNGCLISMVGPEDDAAPFLFFEAGTAVFLPREVDILDARGKSFGSSKVVLWSVHGRGSLSNLVLGKNFALFSHGHVAWPCLLPWCEHGLRHTRVPSRVGWKTYVSRTQFKTSTIYLERAEFGMNYLDCTVWKNAKYRKRDFFIRLKSGNTRVCCV